MFSSSDITDPEFKEAVKNKLGGVTDKREPKDVLLQISRQHGWDGRDIALLSKVDAHRSNPAGDPLLDEHEILFTS
jgi:hypothetical protein